MWESVCSGKKLALDDIFLAPVSAAEWVLDGVIVRRLTPRNDDELAHVWQTCVGTTREVALGQTFDPTALPAIVAQKDGVPLAVLALGLVEDDLIVLGYGSQMNLTRPGVGDLLLQHAESIGRTAARSHIVVPIPNDAAPALFFLQRHGFAIERLGPRPQDGRSGLGGIMPDRELVLRRALR